MALDNIKQFFRGGLMFGGTDTIRYGIRVWMPEFVKEVKENTRLLNKKADRLNTLANIFEMRNRLVGGLTNGE